MNDTIEMILVPRAELLAWAKAWLDDYGPNDGTDCVTPFDTYLLKTPVQTQPVAWPDGLLDRVEAALQKWLDWCNEHGEEPDAKSGAMIAIEALAQQPAAVDDACAIAAIQFALNDPEGMTFLRLWNEGEFETLRREWPEAPSSIYIGADPSLSAPEAQSQGWYCAHCRRGVDDREVTHREQHEVCGRYIANDEPPPSPPVGVEGLAQGVAEWVIASLGDYPETAKRLRAALTADIELLPSSVAAFTEALKGERGSLDAWLEVNDEREVAAHVEAYARANVARATAAKDAEIERLRSEVERLAEALRSFADDARNAFYATGCASCDGLASRLANSAAALRDHDQEVGNG